MIGVLLFCLMAPPMHWLVGFVFGPTYAIWGSVAAFLIFGVPLADVD